MTNEQKARKKRIEAALKNFPKIVEQNSLRGKSLRKLMKAFEPMARDLARRKKRSSSGA